MNSPQIEILPDGPALARRAAEHIIEQAQTAITARGRFRIALSGGGTPKSTYALLASSDYAKEIDWGKVHVFWGDERCVPPDDPQSNYRMANETLLSHVPIPPGNVHRIEGELEPEAAAAHYNSILVGEFGSGQPQAFDLILLGLGTNGHTASLFPGSSALEATDRWVAATKVAELNAWRLTLTYPAINAARQVTFLVSGEKKAAMVARIVGQGDQSLPAAGVALENGRLLWLLDAAAASELEQST